MGPCDQQWVDVVDDDEMNECANEVLSCCPSISNPPLKFQTPISTPFTHGHVNVHAFTPKMNKQNLLFVIKLDKHYFKRFQISSQ